MKLTITDKKKKETFISLFNVLKNCSSVINITFEMDLIHIQGMDKSHICLFDVKLNKTWFSSYEILETINFIDSCLEDNKPVFVHCYWGLMRSATVVAGYLIKRYNLKVDDAIFIVKINRPYSLISFYNFNEILNYVEETYKK